MMFVHKGCQNESAATRAEKSNVQQWDKYPRISFNLLKGKMIEIICPRKFQAANANLGASATLWSEFGTVEERSSTKTRHDCVANWSKFSRDRLHLVRRSLLRRVAVLLYYNVGLKWSFFVVFGHSMTVWRVFGSLISTKLIQVDPGQASRRKFPVIRSVLL